MCKLKLNGRSELGNNKTIKYAIASRKWNSGLVTLQTQWPFLLLEIEGGNDLIRKSKVGCKLR